MSVTGEPEGPPAKCGVSVVDFAGGYVSMGALLAGLWDAQRSGVGRDIDVSLLDTAVSMLSYYAIWTLNRPWQPDRVADSGHQSLVPAQNFPTADGWIVVFCNKAKFWEALVDALELPELARDDRFATFADRLAHKDALVAILKARFAERTTEAWLARLRGRVPCAPVNTVAQALADRASTRARHDPGGRASPLRPGARGGLAREDAGRHHAPRAGAPAGRAHRNDLANHLAVRSRPHCRRARIGRAGCSLYRRPRGRRSCAERRHEPPERGALGPERTRGVESGMAERTLPTPEVEDIAETGTEIAPPWMTILHNCDCHTFEQVVKQLQKAIACSEAEGWEIAWQVHNSGKAVVKVGPETECVRVGNILASIGLVVTVVQS